MPGGNRRGPRGMGPMTGRGMGFCGGYDVPGYANPGPPMGRGGAMGGGRGGHGWRHWFHATGQPGWMRFGAGNVPYQGPVDEREALRRQAQALQAELESIHQRLDQLGEEP